MGCLSADAAVVIGAAGADVVVSAAVVGDDGCAVPQPLRTSARPTEAAAMTPRRRDRKTVDKARS
jgi:hypothetical protein